MGSRMTLEVIALSDRDAEARVAAIRKLDGKDSQITLGVIANSRGKPPKERIAAIKRLDSGSTILEVIAQSDPNKEIKRAALAKLKP